MRYGFYPTLSIGEIKRSRAHTIFEIFRGSNMANIYISYNNKDREFASELARRLKALGHKISIDIEHKVMNLAKTGVASSLKL